MTVVPLHQPRWEPDAMLIESAIAGRVRYANLQPHEKPWLVAQLTAAGHTTDTIAAWLHCSRRTVQTARSEPVGVLTAALLAAERAQADAEHRARAARISPAAITDLVREVERLKATRGQLIDQLAEMRRKCDTPCPPQIVILHPPRRRARRAPECTLPLFEMGA
ncbi:helix-turn-helix domain-containing protein [Nocardia wallacei]|uniref:helix-turn-helix domain-containing protein n=1 Tax=Nocardia wallacei TaxID=480035 RepID=UPI001656DB9C|nr:helix-turn-helix domain-containing protein [Nocardia wallacei]